MLLLVAATVGCTSSNNNNVDADRLLPDQADLATTVDAEQAEMDAEAADDPSNAPVSLPRQVPIDEPVDVEVADDVAVDPSSEVTVVAELDDGGSLCLVPYGAEQRPMWNVMCAPAAPLAQPISHDASIDGEVHPVLVYVPATIADVAVTVNDGVTVELDELDISALSENRAFVGFIDHADYIDPDFTIRTDYEYVDGMEG